jgi:hypothetical protein
VLPAADGQVDLDKPLTGVQNRRNQELVLEAVDLGIFGILYEGVTDDWETCLGGLAHQLLAVWLLDAVDLDEAAEMLESLSE